MSCFSVRRFYFSLPLTIAVLIGIAILLSLGTWQLQRREWKLDLIEKSEARIASAPIDFGEALSRWRAGEDMEYTPVTLRGSFFHHQEADVFGSLEGRAGYYVFTPLAWFGRPDGAPPVVYVNRGYVPQSMKDPYRRGEPADASATIVTGLFRAPEKRSGPAKWIEPVDNAAANEWYTRDPARFALTAELDAVQPYIDSFAVASRQWPKGGTTRLEFANRHLDYALTWYGLALTLAGVYFAFSFRRKP